MNARWQMLNDRYGGLSQREKLIVVWGGVLAIMVIGFTLLDGSWKQGVQLRKQVVQAKSEAELARTQAADAIRRLAQDPNAETQTQIAALRNELERLDRELRSVGRGLVPPHRMAALLQDVVTRHRRVQLVSLKTLPVSSLVAEKADRASADIYKHGMELTLQGSYLDLLDYLTRLEQMPVQMFWANASMDASDYPRVRLTLVLYTLSLDKDWLVV
jgi:MSHA biogenesis protein MshJ